MFWIKLMDDGWLQCRPDEIRALRSTQQERADLWARGVFSQVVIAGEGDGWYFSVHTVDEICAALEKLR
jgi:hypothetical protein